MINYYLRSTGDYAKIDTDAKTITNVFNDPNPEYKTIRHFTNVAYYDHTLTILHTLTSTTQEVYEANKAEVVNYINSL